MLLSSLIAFSFNKADKSSVKGISLTRGQSENSALAQQRNTGPWWTSGWGTGFGRTASEAAANAISDMRRNYFINPQAYINHTYRKLGPNSWRCDVRTAPRS